jgi:putative transposase
LCAANFNRPDSRPPPPFSTALNSFFWSLKHEWTNHEGFRNLEEARLSVFRYIETFYNPQRLHQTLGYLSPNQFEAVHAPATAA